MGKILDRIKEGFNKIFIEPSIESDMDEIRLSSDGMALLKATIAQTDEKIIKGQERRLDYDAPERKKGSLEQYELNKDQINKDKTEVYKQARAEDDERDIDE